MGRTGWGEVPHPTGSSRSLLAVAPQELDPRAVAAFRLHRHGLPARLAGGAVEAASAVCGLQAQVMSCADLQAWARCSKLAPGDLQRALVDEKSLLRTWTMRGTLHVLSPSQYALFIEGFGRHWEPGGAWFRAFGITPNQYRGLLEGIDQALDGQVLSRAELTDALSRRLGAHLAEELRSGFGELLKPAARMGLLINGPTRGQEVTFTSPAPLPAVDPATAPAELLRSYLDRFGPATKEDYARWLGQRLMRPVNDAFAALARDLTEVVVSGRRMWALSSDLDQLQRPADALPTVLLPGFDPYLLGHADRDHIAPADLRQRIYREAGWISPTVLADGVAAGTWEHRVEGQSLSVIVRPFGALSLGQRDGVEAEAQRLAVFFDRQLALTWE